MTDPTELISRYFDDALSSDEFSELDHWLRASRDNAGLFARRSLMEHQLCDSSIVHEESDMGPGSLDLNDTMVLPAIDDRAPQSWSGDAQSVESAPSPTPLLADNDAQLKQRVPGFRRRFIWLMAAAILFPVMLAIAAWTLFPSKPASATLVTSVGAEWGPAAELRDGQRLPTKGLELKAGSAQLQLTSGASVIVQGPAFFHVESNNAIDLDSGRLTADVPTAAHGFTVRTPTARIVDLGTQFGVSVDAIGRTEVHVFQGHVQVAQARGDTVTGKTPTTLSEGDAAAVSDSAVTVLVGGAVPQSFVRSLAVPSVIDVVDLVCGGDGTTHRRSGGIDPRTGDSGLLRPVAHVDANDTAYHSVPKLQVIDGCFVPHGLMKVDSADHTFDFGNTSGGSFYDLRAGGTFAWPQRGERFTSFLAGVDYASSGHGLLLVHPNCGITFDLAALRRLHPGLNISDFRASIGNSYSGDARFVTRADAYVLVDGAPRFERHRITQKDGRIGLDIPLHDSDRFLTIVTTNHDDISMHEWIIFGDPTLD